MPHIHNSGLAPETSAIRSMVQEPSPPRVTWIEPGRARHNGLEGAVLEISAAE